MEPLTRRVERAWAELKDSYAGLTEAQMIVSGVAGEWSVKDVLAHITTWDGEALKHLPTIAGGGRPPRYASTGGIDAFNARTFEAKRHKSLSEVLDELLNTHAQLLEYIAATPAHQLSPRFVSRLRLDTYGHYRLHAAAIREWRAHDL